MSTLTAKITLLFCLGLIVPQLSFADAKKKLSPEEINQLHLQFTDEKYPSAARCAECHPKHYKEWKMSPHAYAQVSPVFNGMKEAILARNSGSNGDFCIRCHTPIGMQESEPVSVSNLKRREISSEGVTCVVCHRANPNVGTVSARYHVQTGDIKAPIIGPTGEGSLNVWLDERGDKNKDQLHKLVFSADISRPRFCQSCHDVFSEGGFHLESANEKYKLSPANDEGITCQDCHMGSHQGVAGEYDFGPAARYKNRETPHRKLTNHTFAGPDFSVVDPTVFPHNLRKVAFNKKMHEEMFAELKKQHKAGKLKDKEYKKKAVKVTELIGRQWLAFDYMAGWGTEKFEKELAEKNEALAAEGKKPIQLAKPGTVAEIWNNKALRVEASEIVQENYNTLFIYNEKRREVMTAGIGLKEHEITEESFEDGLEFKIKVKNLTNGHDVPTGFIAERPFWVDVRVSDKDDKTVFLSGYVDENGDYLDHHSAYVHGGHEDFKVDEYLFSLQSFFVLEGRRGAPTEEILAVNDYAAPRPYFRPAPFSIHQRGRPLSAKIHHRSLPATPMDSDDPGGAHDWAEYEVDADLLKKENAPYKVSIRFNVGMVPPNLVKQISKTKTGKDEKTGEDTYVVFDYEMSAKTITDRLMYGVPGNWDYYQFPGYNAEVMAQLGYKPWPQSKPAPEGIGGIMTIDRREFTVLNKQGGKK